MITKPKEIMAKLNLNIDLSMEEAEHLMDYIITSATEKEIRMFLIHMNIKGSTSKELAGMAKSMRKSMITINPNVEGELHDCCGTGGDKIYYKQEP